LSELAGQSVKDLNTAMIKENNFLSIRKIIKGKTKESNKNKIQT